MQTIDILANKVLNLRAAAESVKITSPVLHLSAEDERTLVVALGHGDLHKKLPDARSLKKLWGYPVAWDATATALRPAAPTTSKTTPAAIKAAAAPKAAVPAPKAPEAKVSPFPKKAEAAKSLITGSADMSGKKLGAKKTAK